MLSCKALTVRVPNSQRPILDNAEIEFAPRAMNAVIGPSGCGKTTLVKAMLKIISAEGESFFKGERIESSEYLVGKVGFAPQFTCAHPMLTVGETIEDALAISMADPAERAKRLEKILQIIGLKEHSDKLVSSLSGGQLRRIGLGMELACDPPVMCCDEVTSGLDPLSENSILDLMSSLCRERDKTFICIIHNLAKLDYFDRVTVVHEGGIVFQGTPEELNSYFEIDSPLSLYDKLNSQPTSLWRDKWAEVSKQKKLLAEESKASSETSTERDLPSVNLPSAFSQFCTMLKRRYKLFFRDSTYLLLTMAISFGFPLVVVIFALGGLPQIESLSLERNLGAIEELKANLKMQIESANTATIVTGLILFQAVLLGLMGSNNSAREIAGERALYEKERLLGLRPSSYALAKIVFTTSLAVFQGVWMCLFVKYVCKFPGDAVAQSAQMVMVCASMTSICLAFSANFSSPDKSSLVSIYLVGFQLPLSGIVLALPEVLKWVCRPFIGTYWGWAGYMTTLRDTPLYDAYMLTSGSWESLPTPEFAFAVMAAQMLAALVFVFKGCSAKKWS